MLPLSAVVDAAAGAEEEEEGEGGPSAPAVPLAVMRNSPAERTRAVGMRVDFIRMAPPRETPGDAPAF